MLREMSLTIALLFISSGVLTNAQSAGAGAGAGEDEGASEVREIQEFPVVYYDINRNLSLTCPLEKSDKFKFVWKKNAKPLEEIPMLKDRYTLENGDVEFKLKGKAGEEDYGNYTCEVASLVHQWSVRGRAIARLPDNTNVVENQKIKLQCKVIGKPAPAVWWSYNATADSNATKLENLTRDGRIVLSANEQGLPGAALELDAAVRADAGLYSCHVGDSVDSTTLRVKDMYAALWPFLGICAEVFVLCAIILVYEKRRTKPELDDSDTDNHDQKKS